MNIQLKDTHLEAIGVDTDEAKYFVIAENIGFSTGDLIPGFNRANTAYVDDLNQPYPKINEAVLLMLPYLNKFDTDIEVSELLTDVERPLEETTNPLTSYDDLRYEHRVEHVGEGWYTCYAFLLDSTVQASGVYYDPSTDRIIDADTSLEVEIQDLLERSDVQEAKIDVFITVKNEQTLHELVGDLTDIAIVKGFDCKEYQSKEKAIRLWESQISGAIVQFNDGYKTRAQQIIEDLENTDPNVQF
jgi:hypothetical protein